MTSTTCPNCETMSRQLVNVQQHMRVLGEEVSVLRRAQFDCSSMANDIYAYQQCVEAQRVELARTAVVKDADVGVVEMLQQLSMLQAKDNTEARARSKEQVRSLKEQVHQLTLRITALTAECPERVELDELVHLRERVVALQENVATEVAQRKQAEAERSAAVADRDRLSVCVNEQRRHMAALAQHTGSLNPDTGVISLMESVRQNAVLEFRALAAKEVHGAHVKIQDAHAELQAALAGTAQLRDQVKRHATEMETMREVIVKQTETETALRAELAQLRQSASDAQLSVPTEQMAALLADKERVDAEKEAAQAECGLLKAQNEQLVDHKEKLKQVLESVTKREAKYVSDIQILNAEAEVSASRVRNMVQRHLADRNEMQKRLDGVTEHRVTLQREVCRMGIDKQMMDARIRELSAEVEFSRRVTEAFKDMQEVFVKHNLQPTAMKETTANHAAKMLELECTRESVSASPTKSKRKGKKV